MLPDVDVKGTPSSPPLSFPFDRPRDTNSTTCRHFPAAITPRGSLPRWSVSSCVVLKRNSVVFNVANTFENPGPCPLPSTAPIPPLKPTCCTASDKTACCCWLLYRPEGLWNRNPIVACHARPVLSKEASQSEHCMVFFDEYDLCPSITFCIIERHPSLFYPPLSRFPAAAIFFLCFATPPPPPLPLPHCCKCFLCLILSPPPHSPFHDAAFFSMLDNVPPLISPLLQFCLCLTITPSLPHCCNLFSMLDKIYLGEGRPPWCTTVLEC